MEVLVGAAGFVGDVFVVFDVSEGNTLSHALKFGGFCFLLLCKFNKIRVKFVLELLRVMEKKQ